MFVWKKTICRVFLILWAFTLCLSTSALPNICAAAEEAAELNYFNASTKKVDETEVLTVEFGINQDEVDYQVKNKIFLPQQLIIRLKNIVPGRLGDEQPLDGALGKRVMIQETELNSTQLSLEMNFPVTDNDYKIYMLPADRKQKKPSRLVVELRKPNGNTIKGLEKVKGHKIVLDAGHGGTDSGAVGPHGLKEKDVSLAVTKKVRDLLAGAGAKVSMTRETDRDVYGPNAGDVEELQARVNVGRRFKGAEIFVSIHCNAFSNPEAHGMETYYYFKSDKDKKLATLLNEELAAAGGLFNRGVKEARFYVMRHSSMPASLVELAFITNLREEKLLADSKYQDILAGAIAKGISRYFQ